MHWPIEPETVAATLPDGLAVDTYDDRAWLSVVPFRMADIRPRGSPIGRSFGELNLRTYVRADGTPGVYFYNLDADDRLSVTVARKLFQLAYYRASMQVRAVGDGVEFRSTRSSSRAPPADFHATYEPSGPPATPESGSLDSFLVERYRFYAASDDGTVYYADIDHEPWPLQEGRADIQTNGLFAAAGFDRPSGDPVIHYCSELPVTAGRLHRLEGAAQYTD
ncbi:MAG: YqjF family protein [Haloarcula sp.]